MAMTQPTLVIPTQYTQQQADISRKRKLAEAMLQQGLTPENNMTSWAQVLGKLAQTWVGRSMDKEAGKQEASMNEALLHDYTSRRGDFIQDSQTLAPGELLQKYGSDPMLTEELKPYADAFASGLKNREDLTTFGGKMVRKGDVIGQYDNKPTSMVFANPDGSTELNPVAVTAQGLSNGTYIPTSAPQTTGQMPGTQRLTAAMGGQSLTPETAGPILQRAQAGNGISAVDALHVRQSMGPQGQAAFMQWLGDNKIQIHVQSPQEALRLPHGTPIILPDGTEGVVP